MSGPEYGVTMQTRFDNVRRHPLCPECGYDLVATVDAGRRICPECGCEFELSDLAHQSRSDDWTISKGLRAAAGWLAVKTIIAGALWCSVLWLSSIFPLLHLTYFGAVVALAVGAGMGALIGIRLVDQAGFAGRLLTGLAIISAAIAIIGGAQAMSPWLGPVTGYVWVRVLVPAMGGAIAPIIWFTLIDG